MSTPENSLGESYHASSANSWETGPGKATESKKLPNNTHKGRAGRSPQSYLLESIFLSTFNGQAPRWDGNTGSWPSLVVAVLWFFTNTRKLILAMFVILMMRESPQMTEFCELQSKDWYTVGKKKKQNKRQKSKLTRHALCIYLTWVVWFLIMHATASQGARDHFTTAFSGKLI